MPGNLSKYLSVIHISHNFRDFLIEHIGTSQNSSGLIREELGLADFRGNSTAHRPQFLCVLRSILWLPHCLQPSCQTVPYKLIDKLALVRRFYRRSTVCKIFFLFVYPFSRDSPMQKFLRYPFVSFPYLNLKWSFKTI